MATSTTRTSQKSVLASDLKVGQKIIKGGYGDVDLPTPLEVQEVQACDGDIRVKLTGLGYVDFPRIKFLIIQEEVPVLPNGTIVKVKGRGNLGLKTNKGWVTFNIETGIFDGADVIRQDEEYWLERKVVTIPDVESFD